MLISALLFPAIVFLIHKKEFLQSKFHILCSVSWIIAYLENFLICESGDRASDGNFSWGLRIFTFIIYCLALDFFSKDIQNYKNLKQKKMSKNLTQFYICLALAFAHLISGLLYFASILLGYCASAI